MSIENDILVLTAAVQALTAALSTKTAAATGMDPLAAQQQAQLDVAVQQQQPIQQQQPVQQVQQQQPVQQVQQQQPVQQVQQQQPVQQVQQQQPVQQSALTQEAVVAELVAAMNRLGPGGQERIIAELSQAFGSHKVPEIDPTMWPGVIQYVRQMV